MIYLNPYQPRRPLTDEEDMPFAYRTHISHPGSDYNPFNIENMKCQGILYRWAKKDFRNNVAIADLHGHLFYRENSVSKRILGRTIKQTVTYKPTKLKAKTKVNEKARWIYSFRHKNELIFGLEWMITLWLSQIAIARSTEDMESALSEFLTCKDSELKDLYWGQRYSWIDESCDLLDWREIWDRHHLDYQNPPRPEIATVPKVLRSYD